ncbi:MAG: sigma 54-interacting transcriptional regulator [Desulfomonilaceae bacterium]
MPHRMSHSEIRSIDASNIPDLFKPLLNEMVSLREFAAGDTITEADEGADRILLLVSGKAEVIAGYSSTQEVMLESLEPGEVFGDLSFLTGRSYPSDASLKALEPSKVLEVSIDSFQRILRENPEFTVALLKSLGKKMVRVGRSDFVTPAKTGEDESKALCAYPAHPGLSETVQAQFCSLAESDDSVVIVGENGVGKEILAYAIFDAAATHKEVFVPLDAAKAGAESFLSEPSRDKDQRYRTSSMDQMRFLFGAELKDEQGSKRIVPGFLEFARDGSLFIRGIHRFTALAQQKLLDALKTGHYCPLNSQRLVAVNFRLVCTTLLDPKHCDPERHPLLHDLRDYSLIIPPLRQRRAFIPALAVHYLEHYASEMKKKAPELDELTLRAMLDYSWPGNDLELANAMRRAVLISPGGVVRRQDLTLESRRADSKARYNLLKLAPIRQAFLSPLYPALLQSAVVPIFLAIVLMLFFGPPDPSKNLASVVMWALAWPGLIISAFFGARVSCSVCPIGALSKLAKRIAALEIPFPETLKMRSDFLIAGGILFIIWIECATDIRSSPFNLGLLLLTMFILAFVLNTVWSRQAWCRYLCPLGGMTGLLARTSILELRADHETCLSSCNSQECYFGSRNVEGCPFGQVVATLHSNQFCKICGNCAKTCPHGAIKLNLRIPGYELGEVRYVRAGTGFLVLGLIGGLMSDILTRTPWFNTIVGWIPGPFMAKFTFVFFGFIVLVNLISMAGVFFSHRFFRERFWENYSRFALALLPLTCMGFLAFHLHYLVTLVPQMFALISHYFGAQSVGEIAQGKTTGEVIFLIQVLMIGAGLLWTMVTMYRLGRSGRGGKYSMIMGIMPHALISMLVAGAFVAIIKSAFPL